jgi:hypothetical protein
MIQVADEIDHAVAPLAACKKGCSHCCHIKVEMTDLEAVQLGEAIGRRPNMNQRYTSLDEAWFGYHTPCPFLEDGECSIYEHRPMACRKNHNLDIDELFCRLDLPLRYRGAVLRLRSDALLALYGSSITATTKVGDIRDWFPGERELQRGPQGAIKTAQALLTEADGTG